VNEREQEEMWCAKNTGNRKEVKGVLVACACMCTYKEQE
jgi:hypothetical protein